MQFIIATIILIEFCRSPATPFKLMHPGERHMVEFGKGFGAELTKPSPITIDIPIIASTQRNNKNVSIFFKYMFRFS